MRKSRVPKTKLFEKAGLPTRSGLVAHIAEVDARRLYEQEYGKDVMKQYVHGPALVYSVEASRAVLFELPRGAAEAPN